MSVFFLVCFIAGLALAVYAMLHGVERTAPSVSGSPELREPSPVFNLPVFAAFLVLFGMLGYLLGRYTNFGVALRLVIGTVVGAACAAGFVALIAKWAIPGAREEVVDERYVLQGTLAHVIAPIASGASEQEPGAPGVIAYDLDGQHVELAARSWDGASVDAGTEVVIDRIEGGVAFVERWAQVEQRL
jgi:hypothetical protein